MSRPTRSATDPSLGTELVHAIAAQDAGALRGLPSTPVTFRAVTPRRFWDAETAVDVAEVIVGAWFGPDKQVTNIISLATDIVGDVQMVSYRLSVDLESGPSVIEQVVYYTSTDDHIRSASGVQRLPTRLNTKRGDGSDGQPQEDGSGTWPSWVNIRRSLIHPAALNWPLWVHRMAQFQ